MLTVFAPPVAQQEGLSGFLQVSEWSLLLSLSNKLALGVRMWN